jgi:hypothetical protein
MGSPRSHSNAKRINEKDEKKFLRIRRNNKERLEKRKDNFAGGLTTGKAKNSIDDTQILIDIINRNLVNDMAVESLVLALEEIISHCEVVGAEADGEAIQLRAEEALNIFKIRRDRT